MPRKIFPGRIQHQYHFFMTNGCHFIHRPTPLPLLHYHWLSIWSSTFILITFNEQKNGVKGDSMGHGLRSHFIVEPIWIAAALTLSLQYAGARTDNLLTTTPHGSKVVESLSVNIIKDLQSPAWASGPSEISIFHSCSWSQVQDRNFESLRNFRKGRLQ